MLLCLLGHGGGCRLCPVRSTASTEGQGGDGDGDTNSTRAITPPNTGPVTSSALAPTTVRQGGVGDNGGSAPTRASPTTSATASVTDDSSKKAEDDGKATSTRASDTANTTGQGEGGATATTASLSTAPVKAAPTGASKDDGLGGPGVCNGKPDNPACGTFRLPAENCTGDVENELVAATQRRCPAMCSLCREKQQGTATTTPRGAPAAADQGSSSDGDSTAAGASEGDGLGGPASPAKDGGGGDAEADGGGDDGEDGASMAVIGGAAAGAFFFLAMVGVAVYVVLKGERSLFHGWVFS